MERLRTEQPAGRPLSVWRELGLIALCYGVYLLVRLVVGLTGGRARARANAEALVEVERALGVDWVGRVNGYVEARPGLAAASGAVYLALHIPLVVVSLVWLARRAPDAYRWLRNALLASCAIAFTVFLVLPVSPPRLALSGVSDTAAESAGAVHGLLQPSRLMNEHAAMPSLHFAWNLIVCAALVRFAPWPAVRAFAMIAPLLMAVAVVATANHYVLDVPAGALVALAVWAVMPRLARMGHGADRGEGFDRPRTGRAPGSAPPKDRHAPGVTATLRR